MIHATFHRYKVMTDCWLAEPGLRPTFNELAEKIGEELQEGEQQVSSYNFVKMENN